MKQDDTSRIQQKGRLITVAGENCSRQSELSESKGEAEAAKAKTRFWSKVNQRGPDDCWEWQEGKSKQGYGQFTLYGAHLRAHRFAWMLTHGPIPDEMLVCHKCDNPPCCNPSHLFLGTHLDNQRDKKAKGRCATGERNGAHTYPERRPRGLRQGKHTCPESRSFGDKNGQRTQPHRRATGIHSGAHTHPELVKRGSQQTNSVLTESSVLEIRAKVASGEWTQALAAKLFSVTPTLICYIIKRKNWTHI